MMTVAPCLANIALSGWARACSFPHSGLLIPEPPRLNDPGSDFRFPTVDLLNVDEVTVAPFVVASPRSPSEASLIFQRDWPQMNFRPWICVSDLNFLPKREKPSATVTIRIESL